MLSISIKACLRFVFYFHSLACIALKNTSCAFHGRPTRTQSCSSALPVPAVAFLQKQSYDGSELVAPEATVPPTPSPGKPNVGDWVLIVDTDSTRRKCSTLVGKSAIVTTYDPQAYPPYKVEGCNHGLLEGDLEKMGWASGRSGCRCIDPVASGLVHRGVADGRVKFANAPSGITSVPLSYGSYCEAWDTADGLEFYSACLSNAIESPSWCSNPWCYVDFESCALENKELATYFEFASAPARAVGFSYETCKVPCDTSCESAGLSASVCAQRSVLCGEQSWFGISGGFNRERNVCANSTISFTLPDGDKVQTGKQVCESKNLFCKEVIKYDASDDRISDRCEFLDCNSDIFRLHAVHCGVGAPNCEEFTDGNCDEGACFGWRGDTECVLSLQENRMKCKCKNYPDECAESSSSSFPFLNAKICTRRKDGPRGNSTGGHVGALVKDLSFTSSSLR